ncbi:MAR-binding filament-like protein 1 isoform X2 [Gouania willdenowi]|uniref:MAR-binding filament-like protein 1 isoform X2 n=1 Tax=Gouania willdenowi TaxID=441366 RepID=UPI00105528EA|nr:MAR-binding filament-like protein 1 isoform X2 [Gouania willdenowi]
MDSSIINLAILNEMAGGNEGALSLPLCNAQKIQLQAINVALMEENEEVIAELIRHQEEKQMLQGNIIKLRDDLEALECTTEKDELTLTEINAIVDQNKSQLKCLEETDEKYTNIIEDLELMNQKQERQLEELQQKTSFAIQNKMAGKNKGAVSHPLCNAEEIVLQAIKVTLMEENEEVIAELIRHQEEKQMLQGNIIKLRDDLEALECYMKQFELKLKDKYDNMDQNKSQLKCLEETVEKYTNIIEDLELMNQEQERQLEEGLQRTSFDAFNESTGENKGALIRPLSNAQGIQLQANEATLMEENQKLSAEFQLKRLQEEKEKNQEEIIKLRDGVEAYECYVKQLELKLKEKDEIIDQQKSQLKCLEETVGKDTNIIEKETEPETKPTGVTTELTVHQHNQWTFLLDFFQRLLPDVATTRQPHLPNHTSYMKESREERFKVEKWKDGEELITVK